MSLIPPSISPTKKSIPQDISEEGLSRSLQQLGNKRGLREGGEGKLGQSLQGMVLAKDSKTPTFDKTKIGFRLMTDITGESLANQCPVTLTPGKTTRMNRAIGTERKTSKKDLNKKRQSKDKFIEDSKFQWSIPKASSSKQKQGGKMLSTFHLSPDSKNLLFPSSSTNLKAANKSARPGYGSKTQKALLINSQTQPLKPLGEDLDLKDRERASTTINQSLTNMKDIIRSLETGRTEGAPQRESSNSNKFNRLISNVYKSEKPLKKTSGQSKGDNPTASNNISQYKPGSKKALPGAITNSTGPQMMSSKQSDLKPICETDRSYYRMSQKTNSDVSSLKMHGGQNSTICAASSCRPQYNSVIRSSECPTPHQNQNQALPFKNPQNHQNLPNPLNSSQKGLYLKGGVDMKVLERLKREMEEVEEEVRIRGRRFDLREKYIRGRVGVVEGAN